MHIAAVCVTYLRPRQLGWMIRCFLGQDYPADQRELIVLDDAGQYADQQGDGWRLVSVSKRFASLGEKRNAAARLARDCCEAFCVWDDDDLYLPWALCASAAALRQAPWSRPSLVLHPQADGSLWQHRTGGLFHGGWAYRRELFERFGGYPAVNNGEDQALARRWEQAGTGEADPCALGFAPFYVYPWGGGAWHLSGLGKDGYQRLAAFQADRCNLVVADPPALDLDHPRIVPGVHPRIF
ncbi:MAG: hypothetical protein ABSG68_27125 [Thermoguttaceae bacterium]|jgi:hypothetical protein